MSTSRPAGVEKKPKMKVKIMTDYEKIRKQEKKTKKVKRTRQGSRLTKHSKCIRKPIFIILRQSQ